MFYRCFFGPGALLRPLLGSISGGRPRDIFGLLVAEAIGLSALGALLGVALCYAALAIGRPFIEARFGLFLPIPPPTAHDAVMLGCVLAGTIPAWRAYRMTLADGLMPTT